MGWEVRGKVGVWSAWRPIDAGKNKEVQEGLFAGTYHTNPHEKENVPTPIHKYAYKAAYTPSYASPTTRKDCR